MPESALLFIHALTGLHPGSGTALGVVDLPVQRERHTQWPTIPGSSLKGVLRETCRRQTAGQGGNGVNDGKLTEVFGPATDSASDHAGALALTDARILAFPVRSMKGVFAWVTCPAVLSRLQRDLRLAKLSDMPSAPKVDSGVAICVPASPLLVDNEQVVLEEFDFRCEFGNGVKQLAEWLAQVSPEGNERLKQHLAVLHDDDFTHFVRHATEVTARVGLDYETKTVKEGALFYEEFLPAETIFYSLVLADDSRSKTKDNMKAPQVLAFLREKLPPVLQIGAGETIGKGLCAVRLWDGKEAGGERWSPFVGQIGGCFKVDFVFMPPLRLSPPWAGSSMPRPEFYRPGLSGAGAGCSSRSSPRCPSWPGRLSRKRADRRTHTSAIATAVRS